MKKILYLLIIILGIVTTVTYLNISKNEKLNELKFSNTQEWDQFYLQALTKPVLLVSDALEVIKLDKSPLNTSQKTIEELDYLHLLVAERTESKEEEIKAEQELTTTIYNGLTFEEIIKDKPRTEKLLNSSLSEILTVILHFKNQFDRVRPNILDTSLTTSISVPGHPAYPSGHATQSYLIYLILSDLDPKNQESYKEDAYRIAHNREIGGLHYPTDSEAGRDLATQYFNLLRKSTWYELNISLARSEWEK